MGSDAAGPDATGRPLEESIGASVLDFLDDDGRAVAAANLAELQQGVARRFDPGFVRPDGSEVWTLLSSAPIHDADGHYAGALAMLTDITERHDADIALQQSEARLGEAQRLALMGNWAFDVKSRVLTCSDALFRVIGVEPDQGIASFDRFILLVHPDDRGWAAACRSTSSPRASNAKTNSRSRHPASSAGGR